MRVHANPCRPSFPTHVAQRPRGAPVAFRVGAFARAIAYMRQRVVLSAAERRLFDTDFSIVLRRAVSQMLD